MYDFDEQSTTQDHKFPKYKLFLDILHGEMTRWFIKLLVRSIIYWSDFFPKLIEQCKHSWVKLKMVDY